MKQNFDTLGERLLSSPEWRDKRPKLLLHSCCAPCSSAVLERLSARCDVTVLYYNPNIYPPEEYGKRLEEQKRLLSTLPFATELLECAYEPQDFFDAAKGLEQLPEGGERCTACFRLRLNCCARLAAQNGFDFFTTTLTVSPLKDAERINRIGREAADRFGTRFLPCDFKKRDGYLRSLQLSREYGLYRQNYCGCIYSKRDSVSAKED